MRFVCKTNVPTKEIIDYPKIVQVLLPATSLFEVLNVKCNHNLQLDVFIRSNILQDKVHSPNYLKQGCCRRQFYISRHCNFST